MRRVVTACLLVVLFGACASPDRKGNASTACSPEWSVQDLGARLTAYGVDGADRAATRSGIEEVVRAALDVGGATAMIEPDAVPEGTLPEQFARISPADWIMVHAGDATWAVALSDDTVGAAPFTERNAEGWWIVGVLRDNAVC